MKTIRFTLYIFLVALLWITGCTTTTPNPLAGFHFSSLNNLHSNKTITDDYQDYIRKLPPKKEQFVISVDFFEDGTGQHAIEIQMGVNGTVWEHILIYDKENKRVKETKFKSGGYRS